MSVLFRSAPQPERRAFTPAQMISQRTDARRTGMPITADQAMRHSTVWACHDLIARTVATLPWAQLRSGDEVSSVQPSPLLTDPATSLSLIGWRYAVMSSLLLRGNAYGLITDVGTNGWPTKIELLHPDDVTPRMVDGEWQFFTRGVSDPINPSDLWHVSAYDSPGSPVGMSPIAHAASSVGLGLEAQEHGLAWFAEGAHPSSILYSDDKELTAEKARGIKQAIKSSWRAGETAVLGSGLKWEAVQVAADEAQFLETIAANAAMICQWFGVAPEMVGAASPSGGSITYANREQRALDFLTFTLRPWLVRFEEAMTRLTPRPYVVRFNTGALLKTDLKTRYESYALALNGPSPWLTVDEVRRFEDRPPMEVAP